MSLEPTGSRSDVTRTGTSLDSARAAKESLGKKLAGEGINVGIGVEPLANSTYGVTLRVQPVHSVSADQLAQLQAIENHDGVPVSLVQAGELKPR